MSGGCPAPAGLVEARGGPGRRARMTILFDGIAYGMLLFVLACGLSVTLGLMNFINLAHGAFAMAGGYITVVLVNRLGVPFLLRVPLPLLFRAARSAGCLPPGRAGAPPGGAVPARVASRLPVRGRARGRARAHALCPCLRQE